MKKVTTICAAAAIAAASVSPAMAGGKAAPIVEEEVFVDTAEPAGSLGSAGAAGILLGVILIGAALSSSSGT